MNYNMTKETRNYVFFSLLVILLIAGISEIYKEKKEEQEKLLFEIQQQKELEYEKAVSDTTEYNRAMNNTTLYCNPVGDAETFGHKSKL